MTALVQINFPYTESQADLETHSEDAAPRFEDVDGLLWKIWLVDESSKTAGGIYLFESRDKAQAYAAGPLVAHLKTAREGVTVSVFDTIAGAGRITKAPVA